VAGTNGKGSTIAMIRAGLEAAGQPGACLHLAASRALPRAHPAGGRLIDEDRLIALLETCEAANGGAPITFFEITTAAAFLAFAEEPADMVLLEVGLGGRLDATNVIDRPRLCVITPVALDHQQFLGETLAEIAFEKAGILKPGVPCVLGPQDAEAWDVIVDHAAAVGAPLIAEGQDWQVWEEHGRLAFQDESGARRSAAAGADRRAPGGERRRGAGRAALLGAGEEAACAAAMTAAEWPARLQRLRSGPLVEAAGAAELWLDGGHNPAAGVALAEALGRLPPRPLHLVTGMLRTKDVAGFLRPLAERAASLTAVAIPGEAATLPAEATVEAARAVGLPAEPAADVAAAIAAIVAREPDCRILICGSLYLAGRVLRENG
jgi:dihydrofolate synthase / folylpolyglutamate synthase